MGPVEISGLIYVEEKYWQPQSKILYANSF